MPHFGVQTERFFHALRVRRQLLRVCCFSLISLSVLAGGCATFRKKPADDVVVAARQKSLRGMEAAQKGEWDTAEALFADAVASCPLDERARNRYADALWRRGAEQEAITQMEEAVRLSGGAPDIHVQLGEMYLAQENFEAAQQQAELALAADHQLASAWALRGGALEQRGSLREAMSAYHRAMSYRPHYPEVQLAAARLYRKQERPQRTLATLQALVAQYRPGEAPAAMLLEEGIAYKDVQRYAEATNSLLLAADNTEPSSELLYHLSEAQLGTGNIVEARMNLARAMQNSGATPELRQLQARIQSSEQQLRR